MQRRIEIAKEARSHAKHQERFMKLNKVQIGRTLSQFPAQALARGLSGSRTILRNVWPHTFFLDASGLHVLELLEVPGMEAQEGEKQVVKPPRLRPERERLSAARI